MNELTTIDLSSLDHVTGGENAGPNSTRASGQFTVNSGPISGTIQGEYQSTRTDWAQCMDGVRGMGGTIADVRATCGLPPGAQANPGAGQ